MNKLEKYLENYFYSNAPAYFNLNAPPYLVKKVEEIKRAYSLILIYDIKFKIKGNVFAKKLFVKKDEKANFDRFGGIKKYQKLMEEIKSYLDGAQNKKFFIPRIYDVIKAPPLVISEYIKGENCEKTLFKFSNILSGMDKNKIILEDAVDLILCLNEYDVGKLNIQENIPNMQKFIDYLKNDIAKEPFILFKTDLRKKLSLYLDHAKDEIKDDSKVGLISGDFQLKNIIIGKDNALYLVDFEPFVGPICLNISQLITQIKNNKFAYPITLILKSAELFTEIILTKFRKKDSGRTSYEIIHFYLIKAALETTKYYFENKKIFWPILKTFLEKDIAKLLSVRYNRVG